MVPEKKLSIKQWAIDDRPREKMLKHGVSTLSDSDLLAIVIGSGHGSETAVTLAQRILNQYHNLDELSKSSVDKMKNEFKGIGEAKAVTILAAIELGRRSALLRPAEHQPIKASKDIWDQIGPELAHLVHEEFWVLYLDRSNRIKDRIRVSQGGISSLSIDIRMIIKPAIEKLASAIILVHNHPSGNNWPSQNDIEITKKIEQAAGLFGISLLDHLIVAHSTYFSFADEQLI